jgi:hypothetical protein
MVGVAFIFVYMVYLFIIEDIEDKKFFDENNHIINASDDAIEAWNKQCLEEYGMVKCVVIQNQ